MSSARLTSAIVGAVATLLVFAGVDALLSDDETTESPPTATIAGVATDARLADCTPDQIALSIEIIEGFATVVVRNARPTPAFSAHWPFA